MPAFSDAGARVYALSYDEPDALRDFRDAHDITFRLLSDPDSKIIGQFGILNTLITEDDHPWFGIPYPGAYVLDGDGVITHKFFENNLAVRAGPEQLLRAVGGESIRLPAPAPVSDAQDEVSTQVFLDADTMAVSVQRDLVARIVVPVGRHVYASPAPEGSVALDLELDPNPALVVRNLIRPPSEPHTLASTAETFNVHHDIVELRLPITINGALTADDTVHDIAITGTLRWQTCDDSVCDVPRSERFELRLPVVGPVLSSLTGSSGKALREPRVAQHFQRMVERRKT